MEIRGTYPMLYAFFDARTRLRRDVIPARHVAPATVPPNNFVAHGLAWAHHFAAEPGPPSA